MHDALRELDKWVVAERGGIGWTAERCSKGWPKDMSGADMDADFKKGVFYESKKASIGRKLALGMMRSGI